MTLKAYAGVARAPFLLLPVTLVAVGTAAAAYDGSFDMTRAAIALVGLIGLHIAVNSFNEASDYRTGIDMHTRRTPFSGGSGVLPAGALHPGQALVLGWGGAAIGLAVGVWFLKVVGWQLLPIFILGAISVFAYTDVLARLNVGELFAGLGLGALPVIGTAMVQTEELTRTALAASLPAFFMTFNLLLLNEFPDVEPDRLGGRRNLILLLGRRPAALVYAIFGLAVPVSIALFALTGRLPTAALFALLPSVALVPPLTWAIRRPGEPVPEPALGANVAWNLTTNAVLAVTLIL